MGCRKWLLELDGRRYTDPEGVEAELLEKLEDVPDEQVPLWCGVMGSTLRLQRRYGEAREILYAGLERANQSLDHATAGDLHQRRSMVFQFEADFDGALAENSMAIARHLDAENAQGTARSLVDRGSILGAMGRLEWALDCFLAALSRLDPGEVRHRYSAHIGVATIHLETAPQLAVEHLQTALELDPDPNHLGKLMWLAGKATLDRDLLEQGVELLQAVAPTNSLFASIDLIRLELSIGHTRQACRRARELTELVGALKTDRAAQLVAAEVANLSLRGELTLAALEEVLARASSQ